MFDQEAQHLGVTATQAAAESNLARKVAGSSAEEVHSLIRGATGNFTVASLNVKDAELARVEVRFFGKSFWISIRLGMQSN